MKYIIIYPPILQCILTIQFDEYIAVFSLLSSPKCCIKELKQQCLWTSIAKSQNKYSQVEYRCSYNAISIPSITPPNKSKLSPKEQISDQPLK